MKLNYVINRGVVCLIFATFLGLASCDKTEDESKGVYSNGVFIVNEGVWGKNNGSISFYNPQVPDSIQNNIFDRANEGLPLGDVIQEIKINGDEAWIIGNTNNNIVVVDRHNFELVTIIEGLNNPRHLVFAENKAFLSEWGEGGVVLVIDMATWQVSDTIEVGTGPERMLVKNSELFVVNSGGYVRDSTVSVIDVTTQSVSHTLQVGDNPTDLVLDAEGNVWVLCYGAVDYGSAPDYEFSHVAGSRLVKIDGNSLEAAHNISIAEDLHPIHLEINREGDLLYVGGGYGFPGIYQVSVTATEFPSHPIIEKTAYGLGFNNHLNILYVLDAGNYSDPGTIFRYDANGDLVNEFTVGIGPNSICVPE